jgi:predicted DNA-binding transcriptional regulator AlpA
MSTEKSDQPTWLELERVLELPEVEELTSLSADSIKRHHRDKLVNLSPRRLGMKLRNALAIANGE